MTKLKDLEPQICDLDNMATIAANIVNNLNSAKTRDGNFIVRADELELFTFAINEVEGRATILRKSFYAGLEEDAKHG